MIIKKLKFAIVLICGIFISQNGFSQGHGITELLGSEENKVLVAAHRGDWKNYPENSIEGIESCIQQGIDIVEVDVHKTKDGRFVLMHDATLNRTTNGKGKISAFSLNHIKQLKLKNKYGKLTNYHVPTLEEALITAKDRIILNLDKSVNFLPEIMHIVDSMGCHEFAILKGMKTAKTFKLLFDTDTSNAFVMPILNAKFAGIDTFLPMTNAKLIEVIIPRDDQGYCISNEGFDLFQKYKCSIWYNALFPAIAGSHSERNNQINAWTWFVENNAKVIQTDYPFDLMQFLIDRNLHKKPNGFIERDLSVFNSSVDTITKKDTVIRELPIISVNSVYIVKRKDTLFSIAKKHNLTVNQLLNVNRKLKKHTKIKTGMKIKIPVN